MQIDAHFYVSLGKWCRVLRKHVLLNAIFLLLALVVNGAVIVVLFSTFSIFFFG